MHKTQEKLLLSIVTKNSNTQYGKKHNFDKIKNIQDFQDNVPLSNYEDFDVYIKKIAAGESKVLTTEPLSMFELSSGSTAASKLIPYTKSLKEEFQRGVKVWIHDLFKHYKGLFGGKIYFSISPVAQVFRRTSGGIPIGFEEDSEYFGVIENILLNQIFAVPSDVKKIDDIDSFRYVTLLFLLKRKTPGLDIDLEPNVFDASSKSS